MPAQAGSAGFVTPSADAVADLRIVDDAATEEYRAMIGDRQVGVIRYSHLEGSPTVLRSSYLDPALRGAGIGTAFIAHVLDERLARGEHVVVECPMIRRFVETHREYAGVVIA